MSYVPPAPAPPASVGLQQSDAPTLLQCPGEGDARRTGDQAIAALYLGQRTAGAIGLWVTVYSPDACGTNTVRTSGPALMSSFVWTFKDAGSAQTFYGHALQGMSAQAGSAWGLRSASRVGQSPNGSGADYTVIWVAGVRVVVLGTQGTSLDAARQAARGIDSRLS